MKIQRKSYSSFPLVLVLLLMIGCSSDDIWSEPITPVYEMPSDNKTYTTEEDSIGRLNAVRKARQMTDLVFTPVNPIDYNTGTFDAGNSYKGLIYSSVKEIETYVGSYVSFHTFMTAVNNPRSMLYTENINTAPYHGKNCRAYYGTVCSGLVSYALGLESPRLNSFDYPDSEQMELLSENAPENLKIADVLWKKGHVALITDIAKDNNGVITTIEISEAIGSRCKRYSVSRKNFEESVMNRFQRIYRYTRIGSNTEYTPANEFVAVFDELLSPYNYNHDLCVNKGDKSNYLEGEEVVLNILCANGYEVEIYKDDTLYKVYQINHNSDIVLSNLAFGDYKARIVFYSDAETGITPVFADHTSRTDECEKSYSDFISWKVVNTEMQYDKGASRIYVKSQNAVLDHVICCDITGTRPPLKDGFYHVFTEKEIERGYIDVPAYRLLPSYPYMEVFFRTEYGVIIQKLNWNK